jgi:hypothetical protein
VPEPRRHRPPRRRRRRLSPPAVPPDRGGGAGHRHAGAQRGRGGGRSRAAALERGASGSRLERCGGLCFASSWRRGGGRFWPMGLLGSVTLTNSMVPCSVDGGRAACGSLASADQLWSAGLARSQAQASAVSGHGCASWSFSRRHVPLRVGP